MTQMPHFTPVISTLNAFPEARNSLSPERKWSDNRAERFWCNNFGAFAFVSLSPLLNSTHFLFLIFGFIHITVKKLCKRGSPIIRHNGRKAANIAMIFKLLFFLAKFSVPGALEIAAWSIGGALLIDLCQILIVFGFFFFANLTSVYRAKASSFARLIASALNANVFRSALRSRLR